jgi:DNA mismatch endonuclease, patch repair protein
MADVFSKPKRSDIMARVLGHGNKATELALIKVFRRHGITGWRRHRPIFGNPDFIFPKIKLTLFVDGCFWHGCPKHETQPATNRAFWRKKLARNKARDRLVNARLGGGGGAGVAPAPIGAPFAFGPDRAAVLRVLCPNKLSVANGCVLWLNIWRTMRLWSRPT